MLGVESVRIGLQEDIAERPADLEFVVISHGDSGDENFPDAAAAQTAHHVAAAIPSVEIPHHAHPLRIGSPNCKGGPGNPLHHAGMGPQHTVGLQMLPLTEQIEIDFPQQRGKGIGVPIGERGTVRKTDPDRVGGGIG